MNVVDMPFPPLEAYAMDAMPTAPLRAVETGARFASPRLPSIKVVRGSSLAGLRIPERRWVVPGWIPHGSVTLLGGDGGVGKSLLALQLMVSASLGQPWLGLATEPMRTFGFFCEDDETEIHIRAASICTSMGIDLAELDGIDWSARCGAENVLFSCPKIGEWHTTKVWHELERLIVESRARLIIIDTAADTFGGEENWRAQVRAFVGLLRGLALKVDGAVILMAHPSVSGMQSGSGLSGSTAWNNSVRSRLYLSRAKLGEGPNAKEDENVRVLKRMKSNYAGVGDEIRMTWQDGAFVVEAGETSLSRRVRDQLADDAFLRGLATLAERGMTISPNPSATFAPKRIAELGPGFTKHELTAAMNRLLLAKRIRVEEFGPPSTRRSRLIVDGGNNAKS